MFWVATQHRNTNRSLNWVTDDIWEQLTYCCLFLLIISEPNPNPNLTTPPKTQYSPKGIDGGKRKKNKQKKSTFPQSTYTYLVMGHFWSQTIDMPLNCSSGDKERGQEEGFVGFWPKNGQGLISRRIGADHLLPFPASFARNLLEVFDRLKKKYRKLGTNQRIFRKVFNGDWPVFFWKFLKPIFGQKSVPSPLPSPGDKIGCRFWVILSNRQEMQVLRNPPS